MSLAAPWLPILVSAVIVFPARSTIHMAPLWHRCDYPRMPRESEVPLAIPRGDYSIRRATSMNGMLLALGHLPLHTRTSGASRASHVMTVSRWSMSRERATRTVTGAKTKERVTNA